MAAGIHDGSAHLDSGRRGLAPSCRRPRLLQDMQDDRGALAVCVQKSLETVQRAVVGSTPSDRGSVADNDMVALLDKHLNERRSTHQVCSCYPAQRHLRLLLPRKRARKNTLPGLFCAHAAPIWGGGHCKLKLIPCGGQCTLRQRQCG